MNPKPFFIPPINIFRLILAALLTLFTLQSLYAQSTPPTITLLEADVQAQLPADQRSAITATIDTLFVSALAEQKNITLIDRQSLDAVLKEHASNLTGLTASQVSQELRPFWAAGVMLCPTVRSIDPQPGQANPKLVIHLEAVLAQTGQSLWEIYAPGTWQAGRWQAPPALDADIARLVPQFPTLIAQAKSSRHIEIADVRLQAPTKRLVWMADAMGDSLRASLKRPTVTLLIPRHPASTREERLLRVMGLTTAGKDVAAGLACTPDFRLDALLTETPAPGGDLSLDKTPITLDLTLHRTSADPAKTSLKGTASDHADLIASAAAWLDTQLIDKSQPINEAQDQAYARQLAARELSIAKDIDKLAPDHSPSWQTPPYFHALQVRTLSHALRASHLDPTNQEAALLVAMTVHAPYWVKGKESGESSACADRVIAEGQRFLDRFPKSRSAPAVRRQVSNAAFFAKLRPDCTDTYRYAVVSLIILPDEIRENLHMNVWTRAHTLGEEILGQCPMEDLEGERAKWREYWKKVVEPYPNDPPPWEFVDLHVHIRKKDWQTLRLKLSDLANRYPSSHTGVWGSNAVHQGVTFWKYRLVKWLTDAGDPEAKTWEPVFAKASLSWNPNDYRDFIKRFNPPMHPIWTVADTRPLPTRRFILDAKHPPQAPEYRFKQLPARVLLTAADAMWFCRPRPSTDNQPNALYIAPLPHLTSDDAKAEAGCISIPWPPHPADGDKGTPQPVIHSWLTTTEAGIPTVWIGTYWHGLARFDYINNKWQGRWYTTRDGLPGEDILILRPAIHEGKPKILVLSQPGGIQFSAQGVNKFLFAFDPANASVSLIAQSKGWPISWASNEMTPTQNRFAILWKDGAKTPLTVYSRDEFPAMDVKDITGLEYRKEHPLLARPGANPLIWTLSDKGVSQIDAKLTPTPFLPSSQSIENIFYYAPGLKTKIGTPDGNSRSGNTYYPNPDALFSVPRAPRFYAKCTTPSAPGSLPLLWGVAAEYRYQGSDAWNVPPGIYSSIITAYRPASQSPSDQNDAWYGPFKLTASIESIDYLAGYLWIVTGDHALHRFSPDNTLAAAPAQSTAQWRNQYDTRLQANWRDQVRLHLCMKTYDQGLQALDAARQSQPTPAQSAEITLWQALLHAQKADYPNADKLYTQVTDNTDAAPFVRGIAAYSLINVRHAAKDGPGVIAAIEKFTTLFPEFKSPVDNELIPSLNFFLKEARKQKP